MSLIAVPVKCKLCGTTIKPPELIIGEDPRIGLLKQIQKMATHMSRRAEDEARDGATQKPHLEAYALHQAQAQNLAGVLMSRCFDLSPELQAYAERERARLATSVRKTTLADADLETLTAKNDLQGATLWIVLAYLKDLRDRYEEIGDYAPAAINAEPAKAM